MWDEEIIGKYIAYLAGIGFMASPNGKGKKALPEITISPQQKIALMRVGGRGALIFRDISGEGEFKMFVG